jgi:hypothetical protein
MRPVDQMISQVDTLTLAEAHKLAAALERYIDQLEQWQCPAPDVVEQIATNGGCYRLEHVRCGKTKCKKCSSGPAHGPYWYLYTYDAGRGRQRKTYIGKNRPLKEAPPVTTDPGEASQNAPRTA